MLAAWLLALARTVPIAAVAPFGALSRLPMSARLGFAVLLALLSAPALKPVPAMGFGPFALLAVSGLCIGFLASLVALMAVAAITVAGQTLDATFGWSFIQLFYGPVPSPLGSLYGYLGTALFLGMGGLTMLAGAIVHSIALWPVTKPVLLTPTAPAALVRFSGAALDYGIRLSLPIGLATLLVSLLTAAASRLVPQMQAIAFQFPLMMVLGMALTAVALPGLVPAVRTLLYDMQSALLGLSGSLM